VMLQVAQKSGMQAEQIFNILMISKYWHPKTHKFAQETISGKKCGSSQDRIYIP
jgi:hypothetical protein